jgi:hypothetical protein
MRNIDTRMTREVRKGFYRQRQSWAVVPRSCAIIAAVVVCLGTDSAIALPLPAAGPQDASKGNSEELARAPIITAKPNRVTLIDGTGSTEIQWDSGSAQMGFVFVTEEGKDPIVFAKGARGRQVAGWIRNKTYRFELYGDEHRQTLLAKVTVSGSAGRVPSEHLRSWQTIARWAIIIGLAAILYFAVYLSSAGPVRTRFPTEPASSSQPLHVRRNLLLGIVAFICLDAILFHTGLYVSILAPRSYAGRIARITEAERKRAPSGLKEVLILGDSRIAEGFSAALANQLGSVAGLKFVSLAEPAASANTWYYMVREVDPAARRYSAIVIPYGVGYEPKSADALRISMAAPLLRYADCFSFASGFQRWTGRFRAFMTCILRGSAYQDDVVDLLSHPLARIRSIQQTGERHSGSDYRGRDYDLEGTSYDPTTGQVTFASKLTESQRQAFRKSLIQPSQSDTEYSLKLQRDWIPRITSRYSDSPTAIVLTPVPRGPFLKIAGLATESESVLPTTRIRATRFCLPGHTFDFLEKPEYYFDAFHLNAKGRQKFTEALVSELLKRLGSADIKAPNTFESQVALSQWLRTDGLY